MPNIYIVCKLFKQQKKEEPTLNSHLSTQINSVQHLSFSKISFQNHAYFTDQTYQSGY